MRLPHKLTLGLALCVTGAIGLLSVGERIAGADEEDPECPSVLLDMDHSANQDQFDLWAHEIGYPDWSTYSSQKALYSVLPPEEANPED